jgi:lipoic acid synthetase
VTYHGPGQLVGYPIFNIKERLAGIRSFIEKIEEVIIATLAQFTIEAEKKEKIVGVWAGTGKICSIGIAVKKWVSFHGFALNVNTDLQYFDLIHPCGFKNIKMTSMAEILEKEVSMKAVKDVVMEEFGKVFESRIEERCLEEII